MEPVWKDAIPSFEMTIGKTKKMRIHQVMTLGGHHRLLSTQQPTKSSVGDVQYHRFGGGRSERR